MFINTALMLHVFNIQKKTDPTTGKVINIDTFAFSNTANSAPHKYTASFTPRFDGAYKLIKESTRHTEARRTMA